MVKERAEDLKLICGKIGYSSSVSVSQIELVDSMVTEMATNGSQSVSSDLNATMFGPLMPINAAFPAVQKRTMSSTGASLSTWLSYTLKSSGDSTMSDPLAQVPEFDSVLCSQENQFDLTSSQVSPQTPKNWLPGFNTMPLTSSVYRQLSQLAPKSSSEFVQVCQSNPIQGTAKLPFKTRVAKVDSPVTLSQQNLPSSLAFVRKGDSLQTANALISQELQGNMQDSFVPMTESTSLCLLGGLNVISTPSSSPTQTVSSSNYSTYDEGPVETSQTQPQLMLDSTVFETQFISTSVPTSSHFPGLQVMSGLPQEASTLFQLSSSPSTSSPLLTANTSSVGSIVLDSSVISSVNTPMGSVTLASALNPVNTPMGPVTLASAMNPVNTPMGPVTLASAMNPVNTSLGSVTLPSTMSPENNSAESLNTHSLGSLTNASLISATLTSVMKDSFPVTSGSLNFSEHLQNVNIDTMDVSFAVEELKCYKCKFCTYVNLQKEHIVTHIKIHHQVQLSNSVTTRTNELSSQRKTTNQMLNNSETSPFFSTYCSRPVTEVREETNHTSFTNSQPPNNSGGRFLCGKCRQTFSELEECRKHLSTVHHVNAKHVQLEYLDENMEPLDKRKHTDESKGMKNSSKKITENQLLKKASVSDTQPLKSLKAAILPKVGENSKVLVSIKKKSNREMSISKKAWQKKMKKEQGSYICEYKGCNVRFRNLDNLDFHRKCHVKDDSTFSCAECGIVLNRWGSMAGHLWRTHLVDLELHACDQCSFKTYSLSKLESLHKRIHVDERPFLCDVCGKGFKTNKQLRTHKSYHQKASSSSQRSGCVCEICQRHFSDRRFLKIHKDTIHNKIRPFFCTFCGYSTSSRGTLKMHIRQHTGEKPFACDVCVYRTSDHNSLRRHKMQHSGERPYKCPYCSYASIQASTYKTHLKIKHPGMNDGLMFSCKQCSFRTLKKDNLATHISSDHPRSPPEATIEQLKSIGFSKLLHSTLNQSQPSNITVLPNTSQSLSLGEAVDIAVSQGSDGTGSTPLFVFKAIEEFNKKIA